MFIFAGKAASAYYMAKKIIRLINDVAKVINNDTRIRDLIKVVYIPNYSVSLAQIIIPAADLHETNLTGRYRSIRYQQHEICPQRRNLHGYAGRRER